MSTLVNIDVWSTEIIVRGRMLLVAMRWRMFMSIMREWVNRKTRDMSSEVTW